MAKGRETYIEGRLQTRSWEDQQGQKRYMTEIVAANVQFLGGQAQQAQAQVQTHSSSDTQKQDSQDPFSSDFAPEPDFNTNGDEIPF